MKNLPLGIQTFRDFIKQDYLYVDKTSDIYKLFVGGGKYYFLSRPRRFGKSVLVSTLAEIFSGNKELFKGLWIYDKIEWEKHPVIYLDFATIDFETTAKLKESLSLFLERTANAHGITLNKKLSYKQAFVELIRQCSAKGRVVILVDEYDKPIIQYMEANDLNKAKQMRRVLKNFYGVIKGSDQYLRFVFITGVSKFSQVSIFSDLNNLTDITLHPNFSTLVGYTHKELEHYFSQHIKNLARQLGRPEEDVTVKTREWYNGYSWDGENFVYNPYSIINLFNTGSFGNFWFSTGTPTFLIAAIKQRKMGVLEFENLQVKDIIFDSFELENMEIASLLFQTGYLTIKRITVSDRDWRKTYTLSYPNQEVRDSFLTHLFGMFIKVELVRGTHILEQIREAIETDDTGIFIRELTALFASIPHNIIIGEREAYYHTVIYLVLSLAGAVVRCEEATNTGRIDAVMDTGKKITVMEFKMGSAAEALTQIKEKKYYEKYLGSGKEITLLGIGFDPAKRNIGNYLQEKV